MPAEFDPEILRLFAALLKKSTHPQSYLSRLHQVYQNSRDFRLLECTADSVLGHTALAIYPYLQATRQVLGDVRDEATIDQVSQRIGTLREQAKTAVDRRALDLLELLVARRAAELQNRPGPHVTRAVAALQHSVQGDWQPGERRLMAELLAALGEIAAEPLSAAQIELLAQLYRDSEPGSFDRLQVALDYATTLWNHSRGGDSLEVLEGALDEFRAASGGVLPESANLALTAYIGDLESRGHFARGEEVLLGELKPKQMQQPYAWRMQRLYQLYTQALAAGGTVSLGEGQVLYRRVADQLDRQIDTTDANYQHQMLVLACVFYRTAHDKHIEGVSADLLVHAEKSLPNLPRVQTTGYPNLIDTIADTLHDLVGVRPALAFLIECMEREPRWLRLSNQHHWSGHYQRCGEWRPKVEQLGELEPRLLALVLDELKLDLRGQEPWHRGLYTIYNQNVYWSDKADDFARAADALLAERPDSADRIKSVAEYFYNGMRRYEHAIEILSAADRRNRLDVAGRAKLVEYLQQQKQWQESIRPLLALVELRPLVLVYRTQLMQAYSQTQQPDKLLSLLKQTDEYFHAERRWNEDTIASLAESSLLNTLYIQSVAYYREAIALQERTQPNRGIGGEKLPAYYVGLAQALAGLDRTSEAVDAACAAIVSWGPRHDQRRQAIDGLNQVLSTSKDLAAFERALEAQVVASGLENPMVRKALGEVLLEKEEFDRGAGQLNKAAEAQPGDPEICRALIAAYDEAGKPERAMEQLFVLADLTPRDLALYNDIAQRFDSHGDAAQAERARTSIVEVLPNEAESHSLLAEIRQDQQRWSEAADQWQAAARLRALEPTGLLKLAEAQIQLKRWTAAVATLQKLSTTGWPQRFGNIDQQVQQMRQQIEDGRAAKSQR